MPKSKVNSPVFVYIDSNLSLKVQYVVIHVIHLSEQVRLIELKIKQV